MGLPAARPALGEHESATDAIASEATEPAREEARFMLPRSHVASALAMLADRPKIVDDSRLAHRARHGIAICAIALHAGCILACPSAQHPRVASETELFDARLRRCGAFEEEQRPLLDRARAQWPRWPELPSALGRCWTTARGGWGLSIDRIHDQRWGMVTGRWSLVHLDDAGGRVAVGPDGGGWGNAGRAMGSDNLAFGMVIDAPVFFDFDGDGEEEIFLRLGYAPEGTELDARGRVWSFSAGTVARYAPSRDVIVEAVRDLDGDGRPELLTYGGYQATTLDDDDACKVPPHRAHGPLFALHALAGGEFSAVDAVARTVATRACPARPTSIFSTGDGVGVDPFRVLEDLACARLWGTSAAEIDRERDATCGAATGCPLASVCHDPETWHRLAAAQPPLLLP